MNDSTHWKIVYQAAMLELDSEKINDRAEAARCAIKSRSLEVSHVTVVSLADMRTARPVVSLLGHTSKKRQSLRREVFADIARSTTLQHHVLLLLEKHPALQREVLMELARNLQLR